MTALERFLGSRPLLLTRAERLRLVGPDAPHVPAWAISGDVEVVDGHAQRFTSRPVDVVEGEDAQLLVALGVRLPLRPSIVAAEGGVRVVLDWADAIARAAELRAVGAW